MSKAGKQTCPGFALRRFFLLHSLVFSVMLAGCAADPSDPASSDTASGTGSGQVQENPPSAGPVLDGTPKSFVVVGYSTSYAWPAMLQEMLDRHTAGERVYHVLNAVIGGSPVGRWIAAPDSEDYQATYAAMKGDFFGPDARLRGEAPEPTVALLQQSLQMTPTRETRLGPVVSAADEAGIKIGADALELLATQLHADGIARVHIAMHIYKEGYEPEVGNERFALERLLQRGHPFVFAGPDVWSATIGEHPAAFTEDRLHPNERGMKIMAELWYRSLAGSEARQEIADALHAKSYDINTMMDEYRSWRRGEG